MLLKRKLAVLLTVALISVLMLSMTAAPAFAFIHAFIPASDCASSAQAGDNPTAENHLPRVPIAHPASDENAKGAAHCSGAGE
jgi:hypothetical protein